MKLFRALLLQRADCQNLTSKPLVTLIQTSEAESTSSVCFYRAFRRGEALIN